MKTRTLKAVKAAITKTEAEVASLGIELPKSRSRMMDIQVRRERVVYKAKVGNVPAQEKLAELNEDLDEARQEQEDFETAIQQGEARLSELETELVEAKKEAGKALIADFAKRLLEEHVPIIDKAISDVITTIEKKAQEPLVELRKRLESLDYPEVNLERKVNKVITGFLQFSFYRLFPRDFERPHAIYRNKSLREMFKGSFDMWANEAIRNRARDEATNVASIVDLSNMRVVPQAEALIVEETRKRMREDAAQLKAQVVA